MPITPRILLIHQFFWAHYKAKQYTELQKVVDAHPGAAMLACHIALNEKTRANIGTLEWDLHQYNVELLFEDYIENTNYLARVIAVLKRIHRFKPNVINIPGWYEPAMITVMFYCLLRGIKVIISSDSNEVDNPNKGWKEALKRFIVSKANGFFCYGSLSAEYVKNLGGKNILMANNSVDNEYLHGVYKKSLITKDGQKLKLGLSKYNFVYVGRFLPQKNLVAFTEAFCKIQNKDWGLILIGDGEYKLDIEVVINKYKNNSVYFLGAKGWREVPEVLALADVLVLPSNSEPWGLVANEAMACGLPVIISKNCGSSGDLVIEGQNGFICDPSSIADMQAKMEFFVNNPDIIPSFGKKSFEIIKQYSPEMVAQQMFEGCYKVLN